MSRPIKLRAWTGDKFIYLEIAHGGQGKGGIKLDPGVYGHLEPWQQFTGLTDKNGKGIYEGDLLKDGRGQIGQVLWHYNSFMVEWLMVRDREGKREVERMTDDCFDYGEVIGNIHENPELLEEHHG